MALQIQKILLSVSFVRVALALDESFKSVPLCDSRQHGWRGAAWGFVVGLKTGVEAVSKTSKIVRRWMKRCSNQAGTTEMHSGTRKVSPRASNHALLETLEPRLLFSGDSTVVFNELLYNPASGGYHSRVG